MLNFFKVRKQLIEANVQRDSMSEQLYTHQRTIEVMADTLEQKDAALLEFVGRLHENMGGELKLTCEGDALARLRVIRAQAERYTAILDMIHGSYDADEALLKRVACALGTSQLDVNSIISRAGHLAGAQSKNIELTLKIAEMQQEIEELEGELDKDQFGLLDM